MKHRRVGYVMTSAVVSVVPETPFKDVAALLDEHGVSGVPVLDDDDRVLGVVSAADLMSHQVQDADGDGHGAGRGSLRGWTRTARRAAAKARGLTAGELMTAPAVTVRGNDSVTRAARVMAERGVKRLPVVDEEDRLVGLVTRRDLLKVFLRSDEEIRAEVLDEVLVRALWLVPGEVEVRVRGGVVTLSGEVERESEVSIAGHMASRIDGVVAVVNRLTARMDDAHLAPTPAPAARGVVDPWLHRR